MDLRTYRGNSMADALAKVRTDLGTDAVILHARALRVGGFLGFGTRSLVEITAAPASSSNLPSKNRAGASPTKPPAANRPASGSADSPPPSPTAPKSAPSLTKSSSNMPLASVAVSGPSSKPGLAADPTQRAARALLDSLGVTREEVANLPTPPADQATPRHAATPPAAAPATLNPATPAQPTHPTHRTKSTNSAAPTRSTRLSQPVPLAPIDTAARDALHDELASIKRLVGQVLQCSRHTAARVAGNHATAEAGNSSAHAGPAATPAAITSAALSLGGIADPLMNWYLKLVDQGVSTDSAELLIAACRDELTSPEASQPEIVRQTLARHSADRLACAGSFTLPASVQPGSPLVIALVGPTGVGKTTTIAKLAATYKLRAQRRVGLITCDTYRIAAVDQLRTYANIIGLPIKVALTPDELAAARRSLSDCDVLLIDTAGRSHNDARRLEELRSFLVAARPHQTHLALSLAAGPASLHRAVQRFATLAPDRLLLTKLDECESPGLVLDLARASALPISFITMGQEVPDQIEAATPQRLASFVMDGASAELPARDSRTPKSVSPATATNRVPTTVSDPTARDATESLDHLAGLYHTGLVNDSSDQPVIVTRASALRQGAGA